MQAQADEFWDVRARERQEDEALQRQAREIQLAIDVGRRVAALQHAAGFRELIEALKGLHSASRHKLESSTDLTDAGLREQRGYTRGLADVIALMTKEGVTEDLAEQLRRCQNLQAEALRRRPKKQEVNA